MRVPPSNHNRHIARALTTRALTASMAPALIFGLAIQSAQVESAPLDTTPTDSTAFKASPLDPASIDQAAPRNDNLESALPMRPAPFIDLQDTRTATREPREVAPSCDDSIAVERGVWYVYEATADGHLALTTTGSEIDTVLSAWVAPDGGVAAHPLQEIACNNDAFEESTSALVLHVRAGQPIYVKAAGLGGMAGRLQLHVVAAPSPPMHDDRATPRAISTLPYVDSVWTATATDEPDEVRSACAPADGGPERGVWYRVEMTASGAYVRVDAGRPAVISTWSSEGGVMIERDCAAGWLVLDSEPGKNLFVKISDPGAGAPTVIRFDTPPPAPGNDNIADAEPLSLLPVSRNMVLWTATDQPDEVRASCAAPEGEEHGVWYHFTAPATGVVIADGTGPDLPGIASGAAVISAWRGEGSHPLEELACARADAIGAPDHISLPLVEGEVVYFKVGASSAVVDSVTFNILTAPINDDLINATPVVALPFVADVLPRYSSLEPNEAEPSCADPGGEPSEGEDLRGSLWYRIEGVAGTTIAVSSTLSEHSTISLWSVGDRTPHVHPLIELACASGTGGGSPMLVASLSDPGPNWLRVAAVDDGAIEGQIRIIDPGPVPGNDARRDATLISTLPFTSTQLTYAAGDDEDEPRTSCDIGSGIQRGIWYSYTPASAAPLTVAAYGSDFPVIFSAWETVPGFPPRELACAAPIDGRWTVLHLAPEPGREILVKAAGVGGAAGLITVTIAETPANDDRLNAIRISSVPFSDSRSTFGATQERDELHAECGEHPGAARSVWYHLTAPADGEIEIDTSGSDFDTVLSLWHGDGHPLEMIECNDDAVSSITSRILWTAIAGETVWIKAGGFDGQVGNIVLSVTPPTPPPAAPGNDNLANALDASRPGFTSRINARGASAEPDERGSSCGPVLGPLEKSVWYRYTAAEDSHMVFDTFGSDFDTVLSAWRGSVHPLEEIACNDDEPVMGTLSSLLELDVPAGESIYLKVSPLEGVAGMVVFSRDGEGTEAIFLPLLSRNAGIGGDG